METLLTDIGHAYFWNLAECVLQILIVRGLILAFIVTYSHMIQDQTIPLLKCIDLVWELHCTSTKTFMDEVRYKVNLLMADQLLEVCLYFELQRAS